MTNVTLKLKKDEGGEQILKKVNHEIEKIKLRQFTDTIRLVKDILFEIKDDAAFQDLFFKDTKEDQIDVNGLTKEEAEKLIEQRIKDLDKEFIQKAIEAFQTLAVSLPDKAIELLSVLSGIKKEDLEQQDLFDVFDIFDAVVAVNDIEALIERVKKSLGATVKGLKFLQFRKNATT